jgi:hypothetical protein
VRGPVRVPSDGGAILLDVDHVDADRLELLDRIEKRLPELDLEQHSINWIEMPDGAQGLAVDGGGFGGDGNGFTFANAGEDVHAIGPTSPLFPGYIGCVVIRPDRSRYLAHVQRDPLAEPLD